MIHMIQELFGQTLTDSAKLVDQFGSSHLLLRRAWEVGRSTTLRATEGQHDKTTRQCLGASDVLAPLKTHNPSWADEMNNALQRALG